MSETVMISACLLGLNTRYDGDHNLSKSIIEYIRAEKLTVIPICPEQLAGLPTPRGKAWFAEGDGQTIIDGHGKIIDQSGATMDQHFLAGAGMCLQIAQLNRTKRAILKQNSPSCGTAAVYHGRQKVPGMGVTAALLKKHKIRLLSEDDFPSD